MAPGRLTVLQWIPGHEYLSSTNWTWPVIKNLKGGMKLGGLGLGQIQKELKGKKRMNMIKIIHI